MKCPDCNSILHCGCKACLTNFPELKNKMITHGRSQNDDWDEECPVCGLRMSVHEWYMLEGQQASAIESK